MTSTRFEKAFGGGGGKAGQSGRKSKKPRVVRGSDRLTKQLSELAGVVVAGQKGLCKKLAQLLDTLFLVAAGIRT